MPNAFLDHYCQITRIKDRLITKDNIIPRAKPMFKITPKIVDSIDFKSELANKMLKWKVINDKYNHNTVEWWEKVVKPG